MTSSFDATQSHDHTSLTDEFNNTPDLLQVPGMNVQDSIDIDDEEDDEEDVIRRFQILTQQELCKPPHHRLDITSYDLEDIGDDPEQVLSIFYQEAKDCRPVCALSVTLLQSLQSTIWCSTIIKTR